MAETEVFQHYEVLKNPDGSFCELGRGAMGVTYKAFDTNLRAQVALKVVNAAYLDNEVARARFQREARVAAGLRHPNVAGVFHLGEEGGNYFYAMEFIDGETLEAFVCRRGPLPAALALNIALQVSRALRAAAKVGLVHRDIKPSNLMLSREDEDDADEDIHVKVIDFGLAKVARGEGQDSSVSLTGAGILGTPHYISPEQLDEKPLDARSDIYSLGITLWYMLTGKPPYSGSLMQVMSKHLTEPPPFEKIEDQPAAVRELLRHMLEKDPARRPQTPSELRLEIEAALRSLGAPALPATEHAADSAPGAAKSEPTLLPIENKKPAGAAEAFAEAAPVRVVTRDLTPRPAPPMSMSMAAPPPPRATSRRGSSMANAVVAAVVLFLACAGFAGWKVLHARQHAARVAAVDRSQVLPPVPASPAPVATVAPATPVEPSKGPLLERALASAKALADNGASAEALAAYMRTAADFPDAAGARGGVDDAINALRATQEMPQDIRQPLPAAEQARFEKVRADAEHAANRGSAPAMLYLGDHLVAAEPAAAIDWFRKAAAQGQPEAMHQLGNMYRRGYGTPEDAANYARLFQDASDRGYPRAKIWLAECYSQGKGGVPQDHGRAFALLNEAYAAEPNNPALLEKLGLAYARGNGTPPEPARAFTLMEQAVELGRASACANLGAFYMNGVGTEKNPPKAAAAYKRGADQQDVPCMFYYALCLENGTGLGKDAAGALAMMQQAADGGYVPAMGYLGTYCMNGFGLPKPDPARAAELYRRGAEKQDPLCEFRYAQCLENGNGVPTDKEQAARLYASAAARNYGPAQEWLHSHKPDSHRK